MSETKPDGAAPLDHDDLDEDVGYKAPEKKTLDEIMTLDKDDEALERYKVLIFHEICIKYFKVGTYLLSPTE